MRLIPANIMNHEALPHDYEHSRMNVRFINIMVHTFTCDERRDVTRWLELNDNKPQPADSVPPF